MNEARDAKRRLRAILRARRESMPGDVVRKKSQAVARWVVNSDEFSHARTLALYRACFGEVDTDDIFRRAVSEGKTALYPRTDKERGMLRFGVVKRLEDMVPGAWGIPEPPPGTEWAPLGSAELVIVPGVAFDRKGGRLGMGGGFYDRMLSGVPESVIRMGLAYEFQVVDSVPEEENDQRLDCLVTESGILRFPERG